MKVHSTNSQLESTAAAEPVKEQLEIPEARESDRTAEAEPHIIPHAIVEESPVPIKEDKPVLAVQQLLYHILNY
jgi:hypothetical protein